MPTDDELRDSLRRAANSHDPSPDAWEGIADRTARSSSFRVARGAVTLLALAVGVGGVSFAIWALGDLQRTPAPRGKATASGAPDSPSAAPPSYLPTDERWAPPTHRDGGKTVMPVTFADGTTADIVYPPELALEELSVYPDTSIDGPEGCGWSISGTRYDPSVGWIRGDAPLVTHERQDGSVAALWKGQSSHEPHDYLVYRFGSWSILVPCQTASAENLAIWAERFDGYESPDGLLVLNAAHPLTLHPFNDRTSGPTIRLSDADLVIDIRHSEPCGSLSKERGGDTGAGDGVVQWCEVPEAGIYIYANAFSSAGKDRLKALVEGLHVGHVIRASSPP